MTTPGTFRVQVFHTDRTRTVGGGYRTFRADVDVLADTPDDACCIAAQIVASIRADLDGMVLKTTIVV